MQYSSLWLPWEACSVVITVTMVTGKLEVFGEAEVPGCVYCIVPFNGRIVAAINNRVSALLCLYMVCIMCMYITIMHICGCIVALITRVKLLHVQVSVFRWTEDKELREVDTYTNNIMALFLKVKGDFILVSIIMLYYILSSYCGCCDNRRALVQQCYYSFNTIKSHTLYYNN